VLTRALAAPAALAAALGEFSELLTRVRGFCVFTLLGQSIWPTYEVVAGQQFMYEIIKTQVAGRRWAGHVCIYHRQFGCCCNHS
jgi:hypothetical protein